MIRATAALLLLFCAGRAAVAGEGPLPTARTTVRAHTGDTVAGDLLLSNICKIFDMTLRLGPTVGAPVPTDNSGG